MRGRKKTEEKTGNEEIDGYRDPEKKTLIDFARVVYIGMQAGYTERELSKMYYSKWLKIFEQFKWHHNLIVQRRGWKEV